MGRWLTKCILLTVAFLVASARSGFAQLAPATSPASQSGRPCGSLPSFKEKQFPGPEVEVVDLTFDGNLQLPTADQQQIAASLRQQTYSGDIEGVTSELEERVRRAWQQHGYFHVQVHGNAATLTSSPSSTRIAVTFELDEGAQYRLAGIAFKNNKAIINFAFLRGLFPIQDGDIFNSARVGEGLEELNRAYGRVGYINFTSFPQIRVDEAHGTIWLDIDFDEGKQFFVSSINVTGLDENVSQDLLSGFLLKPGDVFNKMLLELSMKRLPTQPSSEFVSYGLSRDEKVGTVGIEINFRSCSHIE